MSSSIKWRMVILYVLLVIIVLIMSGSLIVWQTSSNEYKNLRRDIEASAIFTKDIITTIIETGVSSNEISDPIGEALRMGFAQNTNMYLDKKIYILNNKGNVIFPEQEVDSQPNFYNPQVMGALYGNRVEELDSVRLSGSDYEYKGYAEPIYVGDQVEYVLYILASTEKITNMMQETIGVIVLSMIFAILMAAVLGVIFSGFLTKPISVLSQKARDMASGNLDNPIQYYSDDEIGQLTSNFNTMAVSLKDTLEQISSEKNKLEIVFSHMTDGILVFNKEGELIHYNPASVDMLKITSQRTYKDVFKSYLEVPFNTIFQKVINESVQHIIKVGSRYFNICFAKFLSHSETQSGMICVIQDITEHKKLEEMQKEFVANVSHELRTPLTTIKSYTETLLNGAMEEPEIANNFLNVINNEGDRMTALVQDLLDLSRLDNKQTTFIMEDLNLNILVEDSIEKYRIHAQKKEQRLTFDAGQNVYKVLGDANRIEQVIKNIISNAVKYSAENAAIKVSIFEQGQEVIVKVDDSGFGIPEEDLPRIFERFYRVDKARSREMGGTGLGLAIAKEIMEYHGGHITVKSQLGKGTTFMLHFPKISVSK